MAVKYDMQQLSEQIPNPTPENIAQQVKMWIQSGQISVGDNLPPVVEFAKALSVSPATVSNAWAKLRKENIIYGSGRQGLIVTKNITISESLRFAELDSFHQNITIDLSFSVAEPKLLPDLVLAMQEAVNVPDLNHYNQQPIIPSLFSAVVQSWPYYAQAYIAINSVHEGVELLCRIYTKQDVTVVIEAPVLLAILEFFEKNNIRYTVCDCDNQGPKITSLLKTLTKKTVLFFYQPRAHNPCGHTVSKKRIKELAVLLKNYDALIVELDLLGDLAKDSALSLGSYLPQQTVFIRSYLRSYGIDLNLAVLSGSTLVVEQIKNQRGFGVGWNSRMLQHALAWLINDANTQKQIVKARRLYFKRQQLLCDALFDLGIDAIPNDSLHLWLPVHSEQYALVSLAAKGIRVIGGSRFAVNKKSPHIRVSTSLLPEDKVSYIAEALASVVNKDY